MPITFLEHIPSIANRNDLEWIDLYPEHGPTNILEHHQELKLRRELSASTTPISPVKDRDRVCEAESPTASSSHDQFPAPLRLLFNLFRNSSAIIATL